MNALKEYWRSLDEAGRKAYAQRAGTTVGYIKTHLIPVVRKIPRPDLMDRLTVATQGQVTRQDVLDHFYQPDADSARSGPNGSQEEAA